MIKKLLRLAFSSAIVAAVFVFVSFGLAALLAHFIKGDGNDNDDFQPVKSAHAVVVLPLDGEILDARRFQKSLEKVVNNKDIKAVVVAVDSPGGAVGPSEELHRAIRAANQQKPVVCALQTVAASGGLYAASGCRKIVTNKSTLTGSIGVIVMYPVVSSILDRFGISMNTFKSGKFKDTGSPFRGVNDADRALMQGLVDQTYAQFLQAVSEGRGIPIDVLKNFAGGRIILGEEAVRVGLADEIGGIDRAAKLALELQGDSAKPEIIYYKQKKGLLHDLFGAEESEAFSFIRNFTGVRVLYQAFLAD